MTTFASPTSNGLAAILAVPIVFSANLKATSAEIGPALQLLQLSFACPVSPRTRVSAPITSRTLTDKKFVGDNRKLVVSGNTETRAQNDEIGSVSVGNESFEFTANFADIYNVTVDGSAVTLRCSPTRQCIRRSDGIGRVLNNTKLFPTATLYLCDTQTAENVKFAIDELISANVTGSERVAPVVNLVLPKDFFRDTKSPAIISSAPPATKGMRPKAAQEAEKSPFMSIDIISSTPFPAAKDNSPK